MPIQFRDRLVQLESTLERLFGGRPPREPLEVRRAVVESLTGEVRPVGGGRRVLPVGRVTVAIVATDADREAPVQGSAHRPRRRRSRPAARPRRGRRRMAARLRADRQVREDAGRGLAQRRPLPRDRQRPWRAGARARSPRPCPPSPPRPLAAPTLVLRVTLGQAKPGTATCEGERVNIGRQPMVADANGRVVRRNDIAFVGDDEVSRSVSRAHAHVAWIPAAGHLSRVRRAELARDGGLARRTPDPGAARPRRPQARRRRRGARRPRRRRSRDHRAVMTRAARAASRCSPSSCRQPSPPAAPRRRSSRSSTGARVERERRLRDVLGPGAAARRAPPGGAERLRRHLHLGQRLAGADHLRRDAAQAEPDPDLGPAAR